jgi:hypothetical protein
MSSVTGISFQNSIYFVFIRAPLATRTSRRRGIEPPDRGKD